MAEEEIPLYLHWVSFVRWLFGRTEKFPRRVRQSVSVRLECLALDFLEDLVQARYTRDRQAILVRMNLRLETLRVLLRLCHEQKFLAHEGYEYGSRQLLEAGRMVGGWLRAGRARGAPGRGAGTDGGATPGWSPGSAPGSAAGAEIGEARPPGTSASVERA